MFMQIYLKYLSLKFCMIIKIKIDEDSSLTFDTTELPLDTDFDSLFELIKESNIPSSSLFKIAYAYKDKYDYCKQILDYVKTTNLRDVKSKAEIFQMSLDLAHNKPLYFSQEYPYNSFYILLGYENIKSKNYVKALAYFTRVQYKLGIELCNFYLNRNIVFNNELLKALHIFNTKDVSNYKIAKEMFKRNVSKDFYNGIFNNTKSIGDYKIQLNIDIKLNTIRQDLSKIDLYELDNDFFYYLKGKKEHLEKNYDKAIEWYKKSLNKNNNIYAKYNLQRILQKEYIEDNFDCYEYNNFKYFMKYKKCKIEDLKCDVENINLNIKNFINIMSGIKNNPESYIAKYKTLLKNDLLDINTIKNNLIYFKYKNIDYQDLLNDTSCVLEEDVQTLVDIYNKTNDVYVKYNLFYLTRDMKYYDKLNKFSTQILKFIKNGELEYIEIYDKLKNAKTIENYKECLESFYGANGIAICLAKNKKYQEALKIFYSLVLDYNDVYINIGNVYIAMKEYEKGIIQFLKAFSEGNNIKLLSKISNNEYIFRIIQEVYIYVNNIDLLIKIYKIFEISDMKKYIFKLLINSNRLDEAECFKIESDSELMNIYNNKIEERNKACYENKRKAEEMAQYKKSRNL